MSGTRTDLHQPEPGSEARRLFDLNMIKLNAMLPLMLLTVEERFVLNELVKSYFGKDPPPQLPWARLDYIRKNVDSKEHSAKPSKEGGQ